MTHTFRCLLKGRPSAALLIATALSVPSPAAAYTRLTVEDQPNIYLYWKHRRITYWVNREASADLAVPEALSAIQRAFFRWVPAPCSDLNFTFAGLTDIEATNISRPDDGPVDFRNVVRWHEVHWPPPHADEDVTAAVLAQTTLVYNPKTGEIYDADVDVNGVDYSWSDSAAKVVASIDLPAEQQLSDIENVMTHEAGHLLGLGHVLDDRQATMFETTSPGEVLKRDLTKDDVNGLCTIYPFNGATPLGIDQPQPVLRVEGGCSSPPSGGRELKPTLLVLVLFLAARLLRGRNRA